MLWLVQLLWALTMKSRRRWFLQDFAANALANEGMGLSDAVDSSGRMERALRARQGLALDHFMLGAIST